MDFFNYKDNEMFAEGVALAAIAEQYGTPCYVYSRATLERHWHAFNNALDGCDHLICYAVKANSNLAVLNLFARLGSGFDIVSVGELERVLAAGGDASKVVFSGVGKRREEIQRALEVGIKCFNVESESELLRINEIAAETGKRAPISIRVNPDVDAKTHPYISTGLKDNKFGIDIKLASAVFRQAADLSNLDIMGIDCHIGSQLTETTPFLDAVNRVLELVDSLSLDGIEIAHLDLGGGLGIQYKDEVPPEPAEYAGLLRDRLARRKLAIILEPGRAIAGNAGVLLSRVEYLKHSAHKNFAIVDAAMNDLLRPTLYSAWQNIVAVQPRQGPGRLYDVVGPVCETGDFLGKERQLDLEQGDLIVVRSAGAYGFGMSSNYNSRPRVAELMVDGDNVHIVGEREELSALYEREHLLP